MAQAVDHFSSGLSHVAALCPRAVCSPEPQFPHLLSEVVVMLQGGGSEGSLSSAQYTVGLLEVTAVIMGKVTVLAQGVWGGPRGHLLFQPRC